MNHCTIYSPAYSEYKKAAITYNYEYDLINRFTQINRAVKENSLVIFVNPSNPDGQFYDIEKYLEAWNKLNCTILIDESFLDFTNYKSALKYVLKYKNLYILKSMSNFYSCAGVRCATIISNEQNIKSLQNKEAIWKISTYDSLYIQAALKDKIFAKTSKAINIHNNILLENVLKKFKHTKKIYKSDTNFILVQLNNITSIELQKYLNQFKIKIRDCNNFDYLDNKYVRISVKNEKSIVLLNEALKSLNI